MRGQGLMLASKQKGSFSLVPTGTHLLVEPQRQPLIFFLHKQCRTNKNPQNTFNLHLAWYWPFIPTAMFSASPLTLCITRLSSPKKCRKSRGRHGEKGVEWPWLPQKATHLQEGLTSFQAYKDTLSFRQEYQNHLAPS